MEPQNLILAKVSAISKHENKVDVKFKYFTVWGIKCLEINVA